VDATGGTVAEEPGAAAAAEAEGAASAAAAAVVAVVLVFMFAFVLAFVLVFVLVLGVAIGNGALLVSGVSTLLSFAPDTTLSATISLVD
jgi:flagellar biogenesis protein FliO